MCASLVREVLVRNLHPLADVASELKLGATAYEGLRLRLVTSRGPPYPS